MCLQWALMTLLDLTFSMKYLFYNGYSGEPKSAVSVDCQLQQGRNVFQCFVFGPKMSGKSALLDSFLKRFTLLNNYFKAGCSC